MKQILLAITFLLISFIASFGQDKADCPTIKIIAPEGLTRPGEPMNFSTAIIGKFENKRLEYKWTVSTGTISEGQGSPAITVATIKDIAGQTVTATVEIKGLSEGCKNSAFGTGQIDVPPPRPNIKNWIDYSNTDFFEEKAKIQNISIEFVIDPNIIGVFYLNVKETITKSRINSRIAKILKHFASFGMKQKERLTFAIIRSDAKYNRIYLWTKGTEKINCENCEIIRGQYFKLKKSKKK